MQTQTFPPMCIEIITEGSRQLGVRFCEASSYVRSSSANALSAALRNDGPMSNGKGGGYMEP